MVASTPRPMDVNPVDLGALRLAVVGLGLMGGSLAMALRPAVARLTAIDISEPTRRLALDKGLADDAHSDLASIAGGVDLIVLAAPVRTIVAQLGQLPDVVETPCVVLDLGSTKQNVVSAMDRLPERFEALGMHPMCGKERAGLESASAGLYRGQTVVLCKSGRTTERAMATALAVVGTIGANALVLDAAVHDELVAATSHLPFLLSATLTEMVAEQAGLNPNTWQVSASGFRDMARLSGSQPAMMADILLSNKEAILARIQGYQSALEQLRSLLDGGDEADLIAWLNRVQQAYFSYLSARGRGSAARD